MRIRSLFSKYLPGDLIRKFEKQEVSINDVEEREVTLLTAGIHNFNTLTQVLSPRERVNLLNDYFSRMSEIIIKFNGSIDKYFEEKIISVFGFRENKVNVPEKDAKSAVRCAVEMIATLREFNTTYNDPKVPDLYLGIGINTGSVVAANIGSDYLLDYTVIGDAVNIASKIQKLTFAGKNTILFSTETYKYIRNLTDLHFKKQEQKIVLEKKKDTIQVYEVFI
jgi:adenylate cyclase